MSVASGLTLSKTELEHVNGQILVYSDHQPVLTSMHYQM